MNDQLALRNNIFVSLEQAKVVGNHKLILSIERKITASILLKLREELEKDPKAAEILNSSDAENLLFDKFRDKFDADEFLRNSIKIILEEYEIQKKDPGLYIIDIETGRAVIKSDSTSFFQPEDVVLEDGTIHKSGLIVHPKITSSLGLLHYEQGKKEDLQFKALDDIKKDPFVKHAYDHILNPNIIIEKTKILLESFGVKFESLSSNSIEEKFELGKENRESDYQGLNLKFHKANILSIILSKKIIEKYGKFIVCDFGEIIEKSNSKSKWFEVSVKIKAVVELKVKFNN